MRRLLGAALFAAFMGLSGEASANTPKDTLVVAWQFDDILSLDPAEVFEFSSAELMGNTYESLIGYEPQDVSKVFGKVAESWTVSDDGKTFTFKIRQNRKFASGNPITAEDAVFSLQRAILLDKSPAFIIGQFGINKDNVRDKIKQTGPFEFKLETDKAYAPSFVLYCLTANVAAVVDRKLVLQNEKDGDLGYGWLKTHYAGSGPFSLKEWKPNEIVVLERNPNYEQKPAMSRVIFRMVKETTTQRLLLEKGDIDIARNLGPEDLDALSASEAVDVRSGRKGTIWYLGLNQKNPILAKPEVREAMRYLVDYQTIADTVLKHQVGVQQYFLPQGFLGALKDTPYKFDLAKAKELLAKAGYPDGFSISIDTRSVPEFLGQVQAIQQTFAQAGIKLEIIPGDGKQILTKYRARKHDMILYTWGADYQDPNTNADNSDEAEAKPLTWRNAWNPGPLTAETRAAVLEKDTAKRAALYEDLQRKVNKDGAFVFMFQKIDVWALRKNVSGEIIGPAFDMNLLAGVTKK